MPETSFKYSTGTSVSVGSLKTADSCGCGEFQDLKKLADFCEKAGLSLIQLLPVNDTGTESSPYSALSAFALHPLYINLPSVPGAQVAAGDIDRLKAETAQHVRFPYRYLRQQKLAILRTIFDSQAAALRNDRSLSSWIAANPWIVPYAVYMGYKTHFNEASWKEWPKTYRKLRPDAIEKRWADPDFADDALFYAWVQMQLDCQFSDAAEYLAQKGILLKGDIPILMNEDSCDVWAYPQFFRNDLRAGSPPDGFNPFGQNWGFPIYNWKNLEKDGYSWWKQRLHQAERYYKAYRIDHVLGFFRIWAIPATDITGYSGRTEPCVPFSVMEMAGIGFTGDRLRWISRAHVPTSAVQDAVNGDYFAAHNVMRVLMERIGNEELWLFKPEVTGERDIYAADIPAPAKDVLAAWWRNRMLICHDDGTYTASWCFRDSQAWNSLLPQEQQAFVRLYEEKNAESEALWEQQARKILGMLTACTTMIPCAEDLGANPRCMAPVLEDLGIHSLKVLRWNRDWSTDGQPYIPVESYPYLSVATPAVHDSSTVRGWWEQEGGREDMIALWHEDPAPGQKEYSPAAAEFVLSHFAAAGSRFCIMQIQDLLALDRRYYMTSPDDERINRPGSVNDFNWTYRLPVSLEALIENNELAARIKTVRDNRPSKRT